MRFVTLKCSVCNSNYQKSTGHYNRAMKLGAKLFCSQKCFGINRRIDRTLEEKKLIKKEYDKQYIKRDYVKVKRHEYFVRDYAAKPEKYRAERQKRMKSHIEYCRKPEYRKKKQEYDKVYHAKYAHGEFWECFLLIKEIQKQYADKEVRQINNLHNKSQKRKRQWQQLTNSQRTI